MNTTTKTRKVSAIMHSYAVHDTQVLNAIYLSFVAKFNGNLDRAAVATERTIKAMQASKPRYICGICKARYTLESARESCLQTHKIRVYG